MDSARMTRSRARALGATPVAGLHIQTPAPRTTGRRRKGEAQNQEQPIPEQVQKKLDFPMEATAEEPSINTDCQQAPVDNGKQETSADISVGQQNHAAHDNSSVLLASPIIMAAETQRMADTQQPLLILPELMELAPEREASASPVQLGPADVTISPLRVNSSPPTAAADGSVRVEFQAAALLADTVPTEHAVNAGASPVYLAATPLPCLASPCPSATSPFPMDSTPTPGVGQLLLAENLSTAVMSPESMDASPMNGLGHQHHQEPVTPPADSDDGVEDGSPLATMTPLSFTSDAPLNYAMVSPGPLPPSIPASPLCLTMGANEEAIFSPMPEISSRGNTISVPGSVDPMSPQALSPQTPLDREEIVVDREEGQGQVIGNDGDEMMNDATPLAEGPPGIGADIHSPVIFASDLRVMSGTVPSLSPISVGVQPNIFPHASASPIPQIPDFQGFGTPSVAPEGNAIEPSSPALTSLVWAQEAGMPSPAMQPSFPTAPLIPSPTTSAAVSTSLAIPSPGAISTSLNVQASIYAPHTANSTVLPWEGLPSMSTPESSVLPGWMLEQLSVANPVRMSLPGTEAEPQCKVVVMENDDNGAEAEQLSEKEASEADELWHKALETPEDIDAEDQPRSQQCFDFIAAMVQHPAVATQTPFLLDSSHAVAPITQTSNTILNSASSVAKTRSSNVNPDLDISTTVGTTAGEPMPPIVNLYTISSATSEPPSNTTGVKMTKRVSIQMPESRRSTVTHKQVAPTPFRPKSSQAQTQSAVVEQLKVERLPNADTQEPCQTQEWPQASFKSQTTTVAEQRRAKATERLKRIHTTEQDLTKGAAALWPSVGPGYLSSTQPFAVKKSATEIVKNAGSFGSSVPLRQRKEGIAKQVLTMTGMRSTKLTPMVVERRLPMPDDTHGSDDEAEYNQGQENDLACAISRLQVAPPAKNAAQMALRGVPAPKGKNVSYGEKGPSSKSPQRVALRGLPVATGKYMRFED